MRQGLLELSIPGPETLAPEVLRQLGHTPPLAEDERVWVEVQRLLEEGFPNGVVEWSEATFIFLNLVLVIYGRQDLAAIDGKGLPVLPVNSCR